MGRAREFDEAQALSASLGQFWRQGYRATSVKDLEQATGLKPGSLYHAFGSKRELFLRVLDHYVSGVIQTRVSSYLEEDGPPLALLREFMTSAYAHVGPDSPSMACLLINTAIELGTEDAEVHTRVARGMKLVERGMARQLMRAQCAGEIGAQVDVRAAARQLAVTFQGILVASRMTTRRAPLYALTDHALAQLS